jgi:hypothetical protein
LRALRRGHADGFYYACLGGLRSWRAVEAMATSWLVACGALSAAPGLYASADDGGRFEITTPASS